MEEIEQAFYEISDKDLKDAVLKILDEDIQEQFYIEYILPVPEQNVGISLSGNKWIIKLNKKIGL